MEVGLYPVSSGAVARPRYPGLEMPDHCTEIQEQVNKGKPHYFINEGGDNMYVQDG